MSEFDTVQPVAASVMPEGVEAAAAATPPGPTTKLLVVPGGKPDLDEDARTIATLAEAKGQPIRMRLSAGLFMPQSRKQYKHWRGVNWKMEFASLGEIVAFRADMERFVEGWFAARKDQA